MGRLAPGRCDGIAPVPALPPRQWEATAALILTTSKLASRVGQTGGRFRQRVPQPRPRDEEIDGGDESLGFD